MAKRRKKPSLAEMVLHPWSNLRKIQNLDRLPDRRVSKHQQRPEEMDPLRGAGQAAAIYKALGLYAQEESRIELYENYREMDYDPIISAVLDSFGEDGAQTDPEQGRIVWCEANNPEIQKIVTRCLDRTQTDAKAFPTMRTLARDGDVFTHVAASKGDGVISLKAYDPWQVSRMEDDIGRLLGFAPADDRGNPSKDATHSVPYYKVLHFRLPSRDLTDIYGYGSSFLWGARITWRMLQLMLDQVVVQRLLRRPDRVMTLVDTAGMSFDDASFFIEDLKRRMHREWHLNPDGGTGTSQFQSQGLPLDGAMDVVLPRGPNNGTEFTNFPATNQNDLLRDLDMMYNNLANAVGFPHGFMRGEGRYNSEQSLSRQHQPFAKRASRLQRSYLYELVRMCMIDMAYQGLDPTAEASRFSLHMAPVSPILEMERHEVIQMKMDRLERALRLGVENQFDQDFWVPFVLRTYGGFPDDVVQSLYKGSEGAPPDNEASSGTFAFEGNGKRNGTAPDKRALREAMEEKIKHVIPPTSNMDPLNAQSRLVMESSGSEYKKLKPARKMTLTEWSSASVDKRKSAVSSALNDTVNPKTRIEPINDGEAQAHRERQRSTRATVMKNLVTNGRIFNV